MAKKNMEKYIEKLNFHLSGRRYWITAFPKRLINNEYFRSVVEKQFECKIESVNDFNIIAEQVCFSLFVPELLGSGDNGFSAIEWIKKYVELQE